MENARINTPEYIVLHHSTGDPKASNDINESIINQSHKNRKFPVSESGFYVGYHFMVFPNGQVRRYRQDHEVGAHCKTEDGMNWKSLGICMIGHFSKAKPTREQAIATLSLIRALADKHTISSDKVRPHRSFSATECWGSLLSDNVLNELKSLAKEDEELTDLEWCKKHLPEANWNLIDGNIATAMRALAERLMDWR